MPPTPPPQVTPPRCVLLVSDAPGERRKASAVAARLALLGALRGDRRAGTGEGASLDLNEHGADLMTGDGRRALSAVLGTVFRARGGPMG